MKTPSEIAQVVSPSILQKLCPSGVIISSVSLEFTAAATEETERAVDGLLEEVGHSHLYHVGDYVNYLFRTKGEAMARQHIERSYSPETRRVAAWVCKHVATERRLISPSYNHSLLVAGLDPTEQETWLTKARVEKLSTRQLRAELRKRQAINRGAPNQAPADQAASRASEAFEVFRVWYQAHSPEFLEDQKREWDDALRPLVTDYVAHLDARAFEHLCQVRAEFLRS